MINHQPIYLQTSQEGQLQTKAQRAWQLLQNCTLCPRHCQVDRLAGETGVCQTAAEAWVSSYNAHFGEEAPLVGQHGSGTIFFTHCNLRCNFCQNYEISHQGDGRPFSARQLADIMVAMQGAGCHNINFVTPSHVVPQILAALELAVADGLRVPLVYNSSGYDRVGTLELLEGVIDIYMPDFKFWDPKVAGMTCDAQDYPEVARKALQEMHRQVGDLIIDAKGLATRGLLIRHLVLPQDLSGTRETMRFIARQISSNSYVNIMAQYRPCGQAAEVPALQRRPSVQEVEAARQTAINEGITRLDRPRRVFRLW